MQETQTKTKITEAHNFSRIVPTVWVYYNS